MKKTFLAIIGLSLLYQSCILTDDESITPSYLNIPAVNFETKAAQGDNVHQIEDVWVYLDEVPLGVFTLPARIPLLHDGGEGNFRIFAAVKPNGSKNQSVNYPFYAADEFTRTISPGEEWTYTPTIYYADDIKFDLLEGFESSNVFINDLDGNAETNVSRSNLQKKTGFFSGMIEVGSDRRICEVSTNTNFSSANNAGGAIYLEFDYITESDLYVGYITETTQGLIEDYEAVFVPNTDWNRVYINLTDRISRPDVTAYRIKFFTEHPGGDNTRVFLDNVKLIHF